MNFLNKTNQTLENKVSASSLWSPDEARASSTLIARFMDEVNERWSKNFTDYDGLWQWSVDEPTPFWRAVWDFCGVAGTGDAEVLTNPETLLSARFFPNAELNYAENLLQKSGADTAIIFHAENNMRRSLSWDGLRQLVSRMQQALKAKGVEKGDRVAGFLPNLPETVAAMLATASLGAVWSSCSPDFGVNGVLDRFSQIEPKVLFCADGYYYNGKTFSSHLVAEELGAQLDSLKSIVIIPYINDVSGFGALIDAKGVMLDDFIAPYTSQDIAFTPVNFADPLFIMFSSGTTGLPKCIIHSVGGTLIQHLKEHQLQCDVRPGDRIMYFTTCGWMMWNWLVSALASRATIVLFDGSPFFPDGNRLADIVAAEKVTHFGTSAKYIDACAKAGVRPMATHDLSALRTVLSTGSPLATTGFNYIYDSWKKDICLSSIAGGTDILGCFVGGNPIGPVYAGQCQKRHLGMNVRVFDGDGNALIGEPGELVCLSAHPSMPTGFWSDPDGARYKAAYFERFDNVWCQGDWVEQTSEGGITFHGRSDATLNPGGVRIGTAEIYRQVESIEEVLESVVIGQDWDSDVRVVLFVKLQKDVELSKELIGRIKKVIRLNASPRHVPAKIIAITDIPRTKSGKIVELTVRNIIHGREIKNIDALANPEALKLYEDIKELY